MTHLEMTGRLHLDAPPAETFRFFTPEGERLWVPDWDPEYLHPADGALVEGLAFRTRHSGEETLWLVSRYDPPAGAAEYVRVTLDSRIGTVAVRLSPLPARDGTAARAARTEVTIVYKLTALSAAGERTLETFAAQFEDLLASWERSINALLAARA